jgi:hypothetical protein
LNACSTMSLSASRRCLSALHRRIRHCGSSGQSPHISIVYHSKIRGSAAFDQIALAYRTVCSCLSLRTSRAISRHVTRSV